MAHACHLNGNTSMIARPKLFKSVQPLQKKCNFLKVFKAFESFQKVANNLHFGNKIWSAVHARRAWMLHPKGQRRKKTVRPAALAVSALLSLGRQRGAWAWGYSLLLTVFFFFFIINSIIIIIINIVVIIVVTMTQWRGKLWWSLPACTCTAGVGSPIGSGLRPVTNSPISSEAQGVQILLEVFAKFWYSLIGRGLRAHMKLICQATVMAVLDSRIPMKSSQ